jgi:PHD/YefM family antitoxin component YafN of YafNO toxin-antitoxin module
MIPRAIAFLGDHVSDIPMKVVTISKARATLPRLLKNLPRTKAATITKRGRTTGFLISKERMTALIETMEIMASPNPMKALTDFEAGASKGKNISLFT